MPMFKVIVNVTGTLTYKFEAASEDEAYEKWAEHEPVHDATTYDGVHSVESVEDSAERVDRLLAEHADRAEG